MTLATLDDRATYTTLDPRAMTATVAALPEQVRRARALGDEAVLPEHLRGARAIAVLGIGGSAIAGDLLAGLLADRLAVPFQVVRGEDVPAFVGPDTLVIASSYSGNTQETLAAFDEARRRGARALVVTTGGGLGQRARAEALPIITLPAGFMPRAALAFSLFPMLAALVRLGYVPACDAEVDESLAILEAGVRRLGPDVPAQDNVAKQIAGRLVDRHALVYGSGPWGGAVAARWKGQLNENGKHVAHHNVFPELGHNEVESWQHPRALAGSVHLVVLRDGAESDAARRRIEVVAELMRGYVHGTSEVRSAGRTALARLMSLVQAGDFVSVYLALLHRADPSAMPAIEQLKARLAAG